MDACFIQDALYRVGAGVEPQLFQLSRNPLIAPEKVFGPDAYDNVAQLSCKGWPAYGLEGVPIAHLRKPALISCGLCDLQPVRVQSNSRATLMSDLRELDTMLFGRKGVPSPAFFGTPHWNTTALAIMQPAKTRAGLVGSERFRRHPHRRA